MSGMKKLVINTQERAVSTDINRMQAFKDADVSELLRYWLDVTDSDDLTSGVVTEPNTLETPMRTEILNGFLARPQTGSTNVFVDPGVAMMMIADGAADESNYKYVRDPGTTTPGALVIAAGAVATRIDVVEFRQNPTDRIVTDSRDIFDTSTGLFSASTVTKERSAQLEFRVRQGSAGGGMPANQSGWTPIMVASVPSSSTSNDNCTFWDVRPLVADRRATGAFSKSRERAIHLGGQCFTVGPTGTNENLQQGTYELIDLHGRKLGGRLRKTSPDTVDADNFDWDSADNWESGTVPATNTPCFSYFLTPFGLPRWSRYSATGTRLPRSPCGLVVLSTIGPNLFGTPSSAISLPTSTGLGGSTSDGICFGHSRRTGGGGGKNRAFHQSNLVQRKGVEGVPSLAASSVGLGFASFVPVPNTHFPQNAKAVWVKLIVARSLPNNTTESVAAAVWKWFLVGNVLDSKTTGDLPAALYSNKTGGAIDVSYEVTVRLALPTEYPAATYTTPMLLQASWSAAGGGTALTADSASIEIVAWEF
jgi:hypothetical protein